MIGLPPESYIPEDDTKNAGGNMSRGSFLRGNIFPCSNALAGVVVLLMIFTLSGCKEKEEAQVIEPVKPVKLMTIRSGEGGLRLSLPGRVRAAKRSELSFKVSGPLEKLPIDEGQMVKEGDLVAQILPRDFETAISEARARELEADQQFARYKELYAKRQASKADFDRYRAARDVARARLQDARNALKDTKLLAPFDGVISKRHVENFQKVQAGQAIANLQHIDQLEILIDVAELMIAQFGASSKIKITAEFDAVPGKKYPLTIKEYSTDADPATQTYQVVLAMDQPPEAVILPGMTAKVNAEAAAKTGGQPEVVIPALAVLNDADQKNYVWLLDRETMKVAKVAVTIGPLSGNKGIVVTEGLESGDEIVITGITKLREGMQVRPWEKQREGK